MRTEFLTSLMILLTPTFHFRLNHHSSREGSVREKTRFAILDRARSSRKAVALVKLFPHHDLVAHNYYAGFPDTPADPKAALKRCLPDFNHVKGTGSNLKGLRGLVSSFGNAQGGVNYSDTHLNALLTRINRSDSYVVVLYGIHTSGGETKAHVTVQRSVDTTEDGWNDLCHFYVEYNTKGKSFVWDRDEPPTWIMSATKAKTLLSGKQLL